jgi:hypothetical protein
MYLELTSNDYSISFFVSLDFSWYRCVPQNCTVGEKFNAFYGRCEKIQCQPGFNVTLFGKCIGKMTIHIYLQKYSFFD